MSILHITNGDVAADLLRQFDPDSLVLPWRDVLHEGPVPAGLGLAELSDIRALFIGAAGWGDYALAKQSFAERDAVILDHGRFDEIGLWFEWDLYDQLQLIQIVDFFVAANRPLVDIVVVNCPGYLGELTLGQLETIADDFVQLEESAAADAVEAWSAFRSSDPSALSDLVRSRTLGGTSLPFLHVALCRLLEEYPSVQNGLSRCEQNILEALQFGPLPMDMLFLAAHQALEKRRFLGDTVFQNQVRRLGDGAYPLLETLPGGAPDEIAITEMGRAVYRNEINWLDLGAPERWIGGVSVGSGQKNSARWDRVTGQLVIP